MTGRSQSWWRRLFIREPFDFHEIPDWPCPDEGPHADHFWSDGLMGFECPGVPDDASSPHEWRGDIERSDECVVCGTDLSDHASS